MGLSIFCFLQDKRRKKGMVDHYIVCGWIQYAHFMNKQWNESQPSDLQEHVRAWHLSYRLPLIFLFLYFKLGIGFIGYVLLTQILLDVTDGVRTMISFLFSYSKQSPKIYNPGDICCKLAELFMLTKSDIKAGKINFRNTILELFNLKLYSY